MLKFHLYSLKYICQEYWNVCQIKMIVKSIFVLYEIKNQTW